MSPLASHGLETLRVAQEGPVWTVTLHRPEQRNAMNAQMVRELNTVLDGVSVGTVRALVLQGAGGHFCAGGDIKDMARVANAPAMDGLDPIANLNRSFGALLERVDALPCAVLALCEGAVMGGGFGLACVTDVVVAAASARFRLPETSLGISPAQIAPFVVRRIGLSHARRLAVTGETLSADAAWELDLAHETAADRAAAQATVSGLVRRILRNEPHAVAETKRIVSQPVSRSLSELLDDAAVGFARLARSPQASEGFAAFVSRQPAPWVPTTDEP